MEFGVIYDMYRNHQLAPLMRPQLHHLLPVARGAASSCCEWSEQFEFLDERAAGGPRHWRIRSPQHLRRGKVEFNSAAASKIYISFHPH